MAFPNSGGILAVDNSSTGTAGTVNLFPSHADGQTYSDLGVAHVPTYSPNGLGSVGGKVYMGEYFDSPGLPAGIYQLNDDGTINHFVTNINEPRGIAGNPFNGHLFVSALADSTPGGSPPGFFPPVISWHIWDVDPSAGTAIDWSAAHGGAGASVDGLTLSPDGTTLYAALQISNRVQGYDVLTGNTVFTSPVLVGTDGTALGAGTVAGNIFVNTNFGELWEVNLTTGVPTLVANGGSRGDYVNVDPTNGTLLVTQTDSIMRLGPSGTFNIGTSISVTGGGTFTYDASPHAATGTVTGADGANLGSPSISYSPGGSSAPVDVGIYTVTGTFAGSTVYSPAPPVTGTIIINPATPNVSCTGGTFTFDGTAHPATVSVSGVTGGTPVTGTTTVSYTDSTGATSSSPPVAVGTYMVSVSVAAGGNYSPGSSTGTITINPANTAPPLSQGYWKTHASQWPVTSLTIGGITYSQSELLAVMNTPADGDAVRILAVQLIAAKLNVLNGAPESATTAAEIALGDKLLSALNLLTHTKVSTDSALGAAMVADAGYLDGYDNGLYA
jgi:hypothetical protein